MDSGTSGTIHQPNAPIDQDSKEWHAWRSKGLGSSNAPVLMGVSPWQTIEDLWQEKALGIKKDQTNWATERGKKLEDVARDIYEFEYANQMPATTMVHKRFNYILASLDGFNHSLNYGIEIKCPGKKDLDLARKGIIPEKYFPQLQWLMLTSDSNHIDYCSYDGKSELVVIKVFSDKAYQRDLIRMARWFWFHVRHKIKLPQRGGMEWNLNQVT